MPGKTAVEDLTHSQAVNRLRDIGDEVERLRTKEELTEVDEARFAELTVEFGQVDEHRKQLEREDAASKVRAIVSERLPKAGDLGRDIKVERGAGDGYDRDAILEPDSIESARFKNPWDLSEVRTFGRSGAELRTEFTARAKSAIEKMQSANDGVRAAGTKLLEDWDDRHGSMARQILATSSPEYLRAWSKCARGENHLMSTDESLAMERAMSLTDNSGGYLVPFQLDPTVIITSDGSRNQIRQVARQVVATGDVWNGVSAGEVQWSWDGEATQVSDDAPTLAQPTVAIHKPQGFVPISIEALADASNVTAEVGRLLMRGKDTLEAVAFATGSGSGQPFGIITALAGTASEVAPLTAETFAAGDVYNLENSLPDSFLAAESVAFLANKKLYNLIRQFDTAGGAQMWERIGNGRPSELLGYKALTAEAMDATWNVAAAADNFVLALGDFEHYVIADRIGTTVEFVPHLFGANGRPTGQRGWYAYYRVGADSVHDGAFRVLNLETT